jgi:hypothetical protein
MKPNTDRPDTLESKPGSKPDARDDLKSLPLPDVERKLGSSPDGLTGEDTRLALRPMYCLPRENARREMSPVAWEKIEISRRFLYNDGLSAGFRVVR